MPMQLMLNPNKEEKKTPKLLEYHKVHGTSQLNKKTKRLEVERTSRQAGHLGHIPIPHHTIRIPCCPIVRCGKNWAGPIRCFTQTPLNSSIQSSTVRRCKHRLNTTARSEKNNERYDHKRQGHFIKQLLFL